MTFRHALAACLALTTPMLAACATTAATQSASSSAEEAARAQVARLTAEANQRTKPLPR